MQPGIQTSTRGLVALCIVFIVFGIVVAFLALAAIKTHGTIELLSHDRAIDGWEGLFIAALAEVVGVGGIWAIARAKK